MGSYNQINYLIKSMKKRTLFLFLLIVIPSVIVLISQILFMDKGETVVVTVDGRQVMEFPLSEDREADIYGYEGINKLVIRDGSAFIESADCPDKLCVSQGSIDSNGESIVCLPHRVVIKIIGGSKTDTDLIIK